jgi:hypothetical protein
MRHLFFSCIAVCILTGTIAEAQLNSAYQCHSLPSIANGGVSKMSPGGQYRLTCNSGYMVSGNAVATCTASAAGEKWAPAFGRCMAVCQAPSIANGSVVYASGEPANSNIMTNTNVSVKCNPGFTLAGYATNHCGISASGGTWSLPFGSCSGSCQLPAIQNAQILDSAGKAITGSLAPGTAFTVKCNAGFVPPPGASTHGTCSSLGTLSALPVSCVSSIVVNCPPTVQITQADFGTNNGGYLKYSPSDWKLSAGAALALTLPLNSVNVDNGKVLNCGYSSPSGMANLTKQVSAFGTKCVTDSSGKSFACYK